MAADEPIYFRLLSIVQALISVFLPILSISKPTPLVSSAAAHFTSLGAATASESSSPGF